MKITKTKLKQLIREAIEDDVFDEDEFPSVDDDFEPDPGVGDLEADYEDRGHDPSPEDTHPLSAQEVAEDFVNTLPGWLQANAPNVNYDEVSRFIILKDKTLDRIPTP